MAKSLIILVFLILLPSAGYADFECVSVVSYTWRKWVEKNEQTPAAAAGSPTVSADLSVEAGRAVARGKDEVQAKERLALAIQDERSRAMSACKKEHESKADCLATKYAAMAGVLNSLRFEARKSLEEAIASDCGAQIGVCVASAASEPKCADKSDAAAAASPAAGAAPADAKAEKGKKK